MREWAGRHCCPVFDTSVPLWPHLVGVLIFSERADGAVKSLRLHLPVLDESDAEELLDMVTGIDGVVAALVDASTATLEVMLAHASSALLVREQLVRALASPQAYPTA